MVGEIGTEELTALVDEIFGSMAGMQLVASGTKAPHSPNGYMASSVQIVGDWQGAVRLDIDLDLARQACANFTGVEPSELSPQDIQDAAGELANMVGGGVKAVCSPNSRLSLPSVAMGVDFEFTVLQGKVMLSACFQHPCGALTVSVIERQESPHRFS